jgi:hypothetical protein
MKEEARGKIFTSYYALSGFRRFLLLASSFFFFSVFEWA